MRKKLTAFQQRLTTLGFNSYEQYLQSIHWQQFKDSYRKSGRPVVCAVCGDQRIQLHHCTYARLGHESLDDVVPLCDSHHNEVHDWLDKNRKGAVNASRIAIDEIKQHREQINTKTAREKEQRDREMGSSDRDKEHQYRVAWRNRKKPKRRKDFKRKLRRHIEMAVMREKGRALLETVRTAQEEKRK